MQPGHEAFTKTPPSGGYRGFATTGKNAGVRARRLAAAAVALLGTWSFVASSPAYADTAKVQGTDFSGTGVELSFLGCYGIYSRTSETVQPYVTNVASKLGERSLKFDLQGGNAVGGLSYFSSMASVGSASLAVSGPGGADGVAYAGYQEPRERGSSLVWIGEADVSGGGWGSVSAVGQIYRWTKYDIGTGRTIATAPAGTVASMIRLRGDGPGFYALGFGCNGQPYYIDQMRFGGTTLDLEGYETSVGISSAQTRIGPRQSATIKGTVTSTQTLSDAELVLEQRTEASGWTPIAVVPAAVAASTGHKVSPEEDTLYRWSFLERALADGSTSEAIEIRVEEKPTPTPEPAPAPDPTETSEPTQPSGPTSRAPETQQPQEQEPAPAPETPTPLEQAPVQVPETQQSTRTPTPPPPPPEPKPAPEPAPKQEQQAPEPPPSETPAASADAPTATTQESTQDPVAPTETTAGS